MPSFPRRPHRTSIPAEPRRTFTVSALLRRFSTPSPYTAAGNPVAQPSVDPMKLVHEQVHDDSFIPTAPSATAHEYMLTSRGKDYALIIVTSHAPNAQDVPLLYFGEELKGFVVLSISDLNDMQSMDVVLQMFDADPIIPSYEAKRVLLPNQVDYSHVSGGQFCWPFTIASPTASASSSSASSVADSPLGHQLSNGYSAGSELKFQFIVTMYRRGRLNPNIGVRQKITYTFPPDPLLQSSPRPLSVDLPPDPPPISSCRTQTYPAVLVRGVMFGQVPVEVECKLVAPKSYTTSDFIPLSLTLTSENREALDLFAVSDVIDVRLQKVLAFGKDAATVRPLNLKDRSSFHRSDLAARAHWQLDGHARELLTDEGHPRLRWTVELKGSFQRESEVELSPSFEVSGMALVYLVSLFPFRSRDFDSASDPNRALVMGKIKLTTPKRSKS